MSIIKLIQQLKEKNKNLNHSELKTITEVFTESIFSALIRGYSVEIRGLGRLYCKVLKENFNARNPATNELIYKPERVKIKFRPSKNLKKIINE